MQETNNTNKSAYITAHFDWFVQFDTVETISGHFLGIVLLLWFIKSSLVPVSNGVFRNGSCQNYIILRPFY